MRLIFFSEHSLFNVDSENAEKMLQKVYGFLHNLIWIGDDKFSLLLRKYSYLAVNVLSSSPKTSDLIKNKFFALILDQNDEKVG